MATIKVTEIISRVETILQDTGVRWPRVELQRWLNEAYLSILLARPDANAVTGTFVCAEGTRQNLTTVFSDALRTLDVVRNTGATSNKRVIRMVNRTILDDQRPSWHTETPTENIQHWMFDPRQPKEFFVYPPAAANAELEVVYTAPVGAHNLTEAQLAPDSATVTTILLDDVYAGPLVDWVLYRAYSKDTEYSENATRATGHLQAFTGTLGAKSTTDAAADPNILSRAT